jgi:hypothetical protein
MPLSTRHARTLPILLAGLFLAGIAFGVVLFRPAAEVAATPVEQGANREPGCQGYGYTAITDTDVACVQQVNVEAMPQCPVCPGGLNIVFVQVNKAFQADWMVQESLNAFREIERIKGMDVRVAVISYDSNTVKVETRMTDRLSQARSALSRPSFGHDPFGDFEGAARAAVKELSTERRKHEDEPCELVIFFASTKSIYTEFEQAMRKAARMITRDGITLIAGCPETNADYCRATKDMPNPRRYYSEAHDNRMRNYVRYEVQGYQEEIGLREMTLTQVLPPELEVVDGSLDPAPSEIDGGEGISTTLHWLWDDVEAGAPKSVTYTVRASPLGVYDIHGGMTVTDLGRKIEESELDPTTITLTVPCYTPPPPPPPSATPTPVPTDTPEPTPTQTFTPTPTATPTPGPIYIPMILNERCVPESVYTDVVLVLDMSTSMYRETRSGVKLTDALSAARAFVDQLDLEGGDLGRDQVGIVGFNDTAWTAIGMSHDRDAANAALDSLVEGVAQGTRLDLALQQGQAVMAAGPRIADNRPVMILLTDGLPNRVPFGPGSAHPECPNQECTVLKYASAAKEADTRLFTIGLGLPDDLLMSLLADAATEPTDFYFAPDGEDLQDIYRQIAGKIVECPEIPRE